VTAPVATHIAPPVLSEKSLYLRKGLGTCHTDQCELDNIEQEAHDILRPHLGEVFLSFLHFYGKEIQPQANEQKGQIYEED
jgi:hypothetical protein